VIVIESAFSAVSGGFWLSLTITVKSHLPAIPGVPLITPVAPLRESPVGRLPAESDHEYGGIPPLAWRVAE
jgi:hypothetical protein